MRWRCGLCCSCALDGRYMLHVDAWAQVFNLKAHVDLTRHALALAPPSPSHRDAEPVELTPAQRNALELAGACDV